MKELEKHISVGKFDYTFIPRASKKKTRNNHHNIRKTLKKKIMAHQKRNSLFENFEKSHNNLSEVKYMKLKVSMIGQIKTKASESLYSLKNPPLSFTADVRLFISFIMPKSQQLVMLL